MNFGGGNFRPSNSGQPTNRFTRARSRMFGSRVGKRGSPRFGGGGRGGMRSY